MVAALAALLPLAFAAPVQAATDQLGESFLPPVWPGFQAAPFMAQTFTPKADGMVDRVSLPVYTPMGMGMFAVSLNSVDSNGKPITSPAIGTAPAFIGFLPLGQFTDFWFTSPIQIHANIQYAIVVQVFAGTVVRWVDGGALPYTGGRQYTIQTLSGWQTTSHHAFVFEEWVLSPGSGNQPPVVTADHALVTVPEGTTATNTGACSDTDLDTVSLSASAGTVTACTAGHWSWSLPTTDDGPARTITITANDGHGNSKTAIFQLNVTNVAPTPAISWTAGLVTTTLENLDFHGSFTDPDSNDTYTTKWDFGDGSTATGTDASHAYAAAGTYTVTFTVSDSEGGTGKATTTVSVKSTQDALSALEAYVQGLPGLNAGQKNSLTTKLSNAADAAARGDNNAASNQLNAFLNELQAYVDSGKVSPAAGAALRSAVNAVRTSLGSFNRLVEWWPLEA